MRIELAGQTGGGIQFVVYAESDSDKVVLKAFMEQTRQEQFHLHGSTHSGNFELGPSSFNFGTIKRASTNDSGNSGPASGSRAS